MIMNRQSLPKDDQWGVKWGCGGFAGPAALKVFISPEFEWTHPKQEFRVTIELEGNQQLIGAAWLSEARNSAAIPPPSRPWPDVDEATQWWSQTLPAGDNDWDIVEALSHSENLDDPLDKERVSKSIEMSEKHEWYEINEGVPEDIANLNIFLELLSEEGEVLAKKGPKKANRIRYDWQRRVTDVNDPCFGLLPKDCVYVKLKLIRGKLCEKLTWFSIECLLMSSWLKMDPPHIHVACNLKGTGTMATTDPITGEITVNGDEFLNGDWLMEVIIHEISHVIDFHTPGAIDKYKAYKKAVKDVTQARDELNRLDRDFAKPSYPEWQRLKREAFRKLENASRIIRECRNDHIKELLETECRALFYVLAHGATLGYPGEANKCIIDAIKHMIGQLLGIMDNQSDEIKAHVKATLKECFEKMRDWMSKPKNKPVKDAFEKDKVFKDKNYSYWDYLQAWINHFGQ